MKPLPWIAMGLVVVALTARVGGYDLLPDPLGWALVLVGTRALPPGTALRPALRALAGLALAVAALTWVPAVVDRLDDASLRWAAGLPPVAYVGVLAHALATAAGGADDRGGARWWSAVRTTSVVVAALPVLVLGGHVDSMRAVTGVVSVAAPLLVIGLLLAHGSREWAVDPARLPAPGP